MEIQHLDLLRELADRGSVTAVAAAVHRSPSAVSQQLRTLQRQLGVELVRRAGRGVQLTDAGQALARASVAVSTAVAEAEAALEAHRGGRVGVVRLALFPSAAELLGHRARRAVQRLGHGGDRAAVGELAEQVEVLDVHEGTLHRR